MCGQRENCYCTKEKQIKYQLNVNLLLGARNAYVEREKPFQHLL